MKRVRTWKPLIRQRLWFPRRKKLSPPGDWSRRKNRTKEKNT